jgi:hypothetical protein
MRNSASSRRRTLITLFSLLTLSLTANIASAAADVVGIYLTWTRDPTTTMTINWVDLYPNSSKAVYYRQANSGAVWTAAPEAKHLVVEPSTLQRRYVELTSLAPDTLYEFGIGESPEPPDTGWRFRTMPAALTRPIRFAVGGDMMHTRKMLETMTEQVAKLDPDFALLGGDLAYEDGRRAKRVADWLAGWHQSAVGKDRRLIPIVVAIGNHEVAGHYNGRVPDDAPFFYRLFTFPQEMRPYYALDFGDYLSLIILDSAHTHPIEGPQTDWLAKALVERADQTYLFAAYHYPAYGTSKEPKGKLPIDHPRSIMIRQHWVPLFERFGVSAVFEHDHHTFKRTHPIRNHQRDDANGITYPGDGAWGVNTRSVPKPESAWWLAEAASRNHAWIIDLAPNQPIRARAIDPTGNTFDGHTFPAARTMPVPTNAGK